MKEFELNLLSRYLQGDIEALGELVEHYRRPLFGFILRMIEGRDDAEEIFQEVWLRAIRKLNRFHSKNLLGWLFKIAHNLIIDRARARKPDISLQAEPDEAGLPLEGRLESSNSNPAQESADHDLGVQISTALGKLGLEQREVFLMRMEGNLAFKDIARIQRVSLNTALSRMRYAVLTLRSELKDDYLALGDH